MLQFQIQTRSIEAARFSRLYAALCVDDPVLAAHPTLDALLSALAERRGADPATRPRLLSAILTRHQAEPRPLWSAVVLHAFHGMLGQLSKSLLGVDPDEADALVAWALIEALLRVRLERDPARVALVVRQETRKVLFARLRRDAPKDDEPTSDEESLDSPWMHLAPAVIDLDAVADPSSLVPIEDRLDAAREPSVGSLCDEDLLRAHAVRGGLRRLTKCLFEHAGARHREHVYRQLLRRAQQLAMRRK